MKMQKECPLGLEVVGSDGDCGLGRNCRYFCGLEERCDFERRMETERLDRDRLEGRHQR